MGLRSSVIDGEYCPYNADLDNDAAFGGKAMGSRLDQVLWNENGGNPFSSFCPPLPDTKLLQELIEKEALKRPDYDGYTEVLAEEKEQLTNSINEV